MQTSLLPGNDAAPTGKKAGGGDNIMKIKKTQLQDEEGAMRSPQTALNKGRLLSVLHWERGKLKRTGGKKKRGKQVSSYTRLNIN